MGAIEYLKPNTKTDTISRVFAVVAEQAGVAKKTLTIATTLTELNLDSLDLMELVMGLEEEFLIEISDEELDKAKLETVADLVQFVSSFIVKREARVESKPDQTGLAKDKRMAQLEDALRMMLEVTDEWKQTDNAFAYGRLVLDDDPRIGKS
jgi:acyl carrier protein